MTFPSLTLAARLTGRLVYVAGPYRADTEEERLAHVARAARLGRLVMDAGGVPIVVHPSIAAGVYGDPGDATGPRATAERTRGMARTLSIALHVSTMGGACVALTREDGTFSEGTEREVGVFRAEDVFPVRPSEVEP